MLSYITFESITADFVFSPSVFDFHQATDGIQEQQRQEQAGKKYVLFFVGGCVCAVLSISGLFLFQF